MAAQTANAVGVGQYNVAGTTLSSLNNPLSLDIFQVYGPGGVVLINCTSAGVINKNPASPTGQALLGRYESRLGSTAATANIFADTFFIEMATLPVAGGTPDVFQVRGPGQLGIFHVDASGTAFSS